MENNQIAVIIIIAVVLLFLFGGFGMIGCNNYGMGGMMNWMIGGGFGTMWIFGSIIWILIIIAFVLFIMWLIKQLQNTGKKNNGKRR